MIKKAIFRGMIPFVIMTSLAIFYDTSRGSMFFKLKVHFWLALLLPR